jgi:hypothetical protein
MQPLVFAALAEAVAALGLCVTLALGSALIVPGLFRELLQNAELRNLLAHGVVWGAPLLALAMVVLHLAHGVALDAAARRHGSRQLGRGVRFGLYSCGWDLVTLPLGLAVLMLTDGPVTALRHSARGLTAPNRAALSYLAYVHQLPREGAVKVARRAVAVVFVPLLALIVLGFVVGLAWAAR